MVGTVEVMIGDVYYVRIILYQFDRISASPIFCLEFINTNSEQKMTN